MFCVRVLRQMATLVDAIPECRTAIQMLPDEPGVAVLFVFQFGGEKYSHRVLVMPDVSDAYVAQVIEEACQKVHASYLQMLHGEDYSTIGLQLHERRLKAGF